MLAKLNRIPYFLWLNKNIEIELDHKNKTVKLLGGETSFTTVKEWLIILIKHIPMLIVALFFMADLEMVKYIENYFVLLTVLGFVFGGFYLFGRYKIILMPFILLGSFMIIWGFLNGYARDMDYSFAIAMQLGVISLVLYDMYKLGKGDKYYYLDDASKEIIKEFKIKKKSKRLSFLIGGMFLKVEADEK